MNELPKIVRDQLYRQTPPGEHPDADLLNAYAEHSLNARERERVLAHLAECSTCRAVVQLAAIPLLSEAVRDRESPSQAREGAARLLTGVAAALVIVSLTWIAVWPPWQHRSDQVADAHRAQLPGREAPPTVVASNLTKPANTARPLTPSVTKSAVHSRSHARRSVRPSNAERLDSTESVTEALNANAMQESTSPLEQAPRLMPNAPDEARRESASGGRAFADAKRRPAAGDPAMREEPSQVKAAVPPTSRAPSASADVATITTARASVPTAAAPPAPLNAREQSRRAASNSIREELFPAIVPENTVSRRSEPLVHAVVSSAGLWTISSDANLQQSTDGGNTWRTVRISGSPKITTVASAGRLLWAGGENAAVYRSANGGESWSRVYVGLGISNATGTVNRIQFTDELVGTVQTSTGEKWSTADAGHTWSLVSYRP